MSQEDVMTVRYKDRMRPRITPNSPAERQMAALVGGAEIFSELMMIMETFTESEQRIEGFRQKWGNNVNVTTIITGLKTNAAFFEQFIRSKPTRITSEGNNTLYMTYAIEKFRNGGRIALSSIL
jgi:hypothetical protein